MALTSSAALGVSELDGRTDRREEVWDRDGEMRGRTENERKNLTVHAAPQSVPANAKSALCVNATVPTGETDKTFTLFLK